MTQRAGAHSYSMRIIVDIESLADKVLRVLITRPDGSTFERTTASNDVEVLDEAAKIIGVRIEAGDLPVEGTYQFQVWDETASASVRSDIERFYVGPSLQQPTP